MNESDATTENQEQEDQTSVTDTNAQNGDESVTDANAQQSSQDSNANGDQEGADASTSTGADSQSDDTSSDDAENAREQEVQAIRTRGEEQRKRLANRLAQQGRERVATERELETERQKREQLEAENRRLREQHSDNGQSRDNQQDTGGADDDDQTDTSTNTNTGSDGRSAQLEVENKALRRQITDSEAEEGGFYEEFSDDPAIVQIQMAHNMKVLREALIAQGDAEQNRQEREVHSQFVVEYTKQGIDQETAEQLVALDIEALEAENVTDKLKIQQDGKKLYVDALSKGTVRKQRQDDARKQQLQDRTSTAGTNGGQGAAVAGDVPPVESELKNLEGMDFDEMMDHIEKLEGQYGAEFTEALLQRI